MHVRSERDEWLMGQVAEGRRDHLEPLVRRYASPLLTFIRRMVGDTHRSEELFQDVFLAVWSKRKQYQFPRPFKSWLFAIAVNKCYASLRSQPARRSVSLQEELWVPAGRGPHPEDDAIATETAAIVETAVTRLPAQQRTVIVLRIWQGLSYPEIAEIVQRTEATVRSHMHHGLASLRKILEPHLAQEI